MAATTDEVSAALSGRSLVEVIGERVDVVDLTHDSRQVEPGWAFACVVGAQRDGHEFAAEAVDRGASALLVERRLPLDVTQLVVDDVRSAMGLAAAAVHGHPSSALRMVGITGTNGKTTTTQLLQSALGGLDTRVLGTLTGSMTTPEAPDLQRRFARFVAEGADAVVMEVSSHALALDRIAGTRFDVGVFTNLGRDHLDLHGSMEAYFRAKARLFTPGLSALGVVNADDPHGALLLDAAEIPMVPFSESDATEVEVGIDRIVLTWRERRVAAPIGGAFNLGNVLAALTAAVALGVDPDDAIAGLAEADTVPGRFESVDTGDRGFGVVVDYAHTPDGLDALLPAVRAASDGGRILTVFGCGGDRDVDKRPLMGAAAARHSDVVIATSDNPRGEEPMAIIEAAVAGIDPGYRGDVLIEPDRRAAISVAIGRARAGDVVVIAGKGHETTQTIGTDVVHFDDRQVARGVLADMDDHDGTGARS